MSNVLLINPTGRTVDVPEGHPAIEKAERGDGGWKFADEPGEVSEKGEPSGSPDPEPDPVKRGPGRPRKGN